MSVRIVAATTGIAEAVERLRAGQMVAFPTETVYGLGASATDGEAVARIFRAKGRPATNPLIVHVADAAAARALASGWTETAERLAKAFWPGPLTLVLPKTSAVPEIVTAGGKTVGLRVPGHPVALELLRSTGLPVAAPSANRSEEVSPTTAQHVADSLGRYVDDLLILDGGPCQVGIESTVLDMTTEPPRILRPGMITAPMLHSILGDVVEGAEGGQIARSPGQMRRHYAPSVPVVIMPPRYLFEEEFGREEGLLLLTIGSDVLSRTIGFAVRRENEIHMPVSPEKYARRLYSALRELEARGVSRITVEEPPHTPEWAPIHDRLRRAAAPKESKGQGNVM